MTEERTRQTFVVLGAGALGSAFGGMLAKAGHHVHLVGRAGHMDAILRDGLALTGLWGEHQIGNLRCGICLDENVSPDWVLLTTKAYDTERAAAQIPMKWLPKAQVAVLQNGWGNQGIAQDRFGPANMIAGMVIIGFEIVEPARVDVTVSADSVKLGRLGGGTDRKVAELTALFKSANIPAEDVVDIAKYLWSKVLYNAALNALGAIMDTNYGSLLQPEIWRIMEDVIHEAFAVMSAAGVSTFWETAEDYLNYLKGYQIPATFDHHPSMLKDIMKKRPTEIDFINGAIVKLGKEYDVATPVNTTLVRLIKGLESRVAGCACADPKTRWIG